MRTVRQSRFGEYEKRMSEKRKLKDLSRMDWNTEDTSNNSIQTSALIRIADATEIIAEDYLSLLKQLKSVESRANSYEQLFRDERTETKRLQRSIIAHKANYTRLKNKLKELEKSSDNHLETCGTAFRGCDPNCPKEIAEKNKQENK